MTNKFRQHKFKVEVKVEKANNEVASAFIADEVIRPQ
jgi:hypothetical protein